jgi:M6 family metalloprotease-like protein
MIFSYFLPQKAALSGAAAFLFFFILQPMTIFAVPAHPGPFETEQPDGKKIKIHLRGDEHFSWHEDAQGYAVKRDDKDFYWKYARPKEDKADFEVIDGADVGSADPVKLKLKKRDLPKKELLQELSGSDQQPDMSAAAQETQAAGDDIESQIDPPIFEIPASGTKTIKNIVILASFSDHWDAGTGTVLSGKGRADAAEYANLFNQIGHISDGAVGSVKEYYREVSYGKLTVDSIVTPWVRLPYSEAYYGAGKPDANPKQMVADAIAAADAAGFNFAQGDSDGDGWVDGLTIIHSGHGQEISGNPSDCVWSHQGSMATIVTADGVKMKRYHTEPALRGATSSTSIIRIGVIAHEMGHFFGLPDLYDYSSQTHGLGDWCLMAGGSWNGSDGKSPAHFSAWAKAMLGFLVPEPQYASSGKSLPRVEDNPVVHLYRDGMSSDEYFLVENRAKYGFDNSAEIYPGIIIYHVDGKSSNNDLSTWPHPAVKIEEADGNNSLGLNAAQSQAGDVWTNTSGVAGGFSDSTGVQSTNAMIYQSHYYNRLNSSPSYSYIRLKNFSAAGAAMTYTAETLRPHVADTSSSTGSYSVTWGTSSNAVQYEIQEGNETTLTSFFDGAESESVMFDSWAAQGNARRNNGGYRTGSWSYVLQYYDSAAGKWYSSVQTLTLRKPFTVKSSTSISFYYRSGLQADSGYLKYQVSKDGGNTWLTLGTQTGTQSSWAQKNYSYSNLMSVGVAENDSVIFRFAADFEQASGAETWPSYGYAIDDFQISGTEIKGYGNWTTLSSNVGSTSYAVSGKSSGKYAYRVRAYANGLWQNYGSVGLATVSTSSYQLSVSKSGAGSGTVSSSPAGISCGSACSASFASGQSVTLTASPSVGSAFTGWSGACSGTASTCTVSMTQARSVGAAFSLNSYTVTPSAGANGSISPNTPQTVSHGSTASFTVTPAAGYAASVTGCGGVLSGSTYTTGPVTGSCSVTASFTQITYQLSVSKSGTGSGTVSSSPSGISCGSACSASFASGQSVTLTASPSAGSTFTGWSGACSGTAATCTVSMTQARSTDAAFNQQPAGSLSTCLDNSSLTWTTGGNAAWFCQSTTSVSGGSSAQSGIIADNQESWIETAVFGPGTIRFFWRVSSEQDWDFLKFSLDGTERASISGETGWIYKAFFVDEGPHVLRWTYTKDSSFASGSDAGWLDNVQYIVKTGEEEGDAKSWLPAVKLLLKR